MVYSLSVEEKKQCIQYVYKGSSSSIHERLMGPVWTKIEMYIPDCICPTMVTTIGLVANLIPCVILMTMAPTAQERVPNWILIWCCFGMFTHLNLDNMDGRRARRFDVETAVTDIFDHMVDAVTTGITIVNCSIAIKLGNFPELMAFWLMVFLVVFYCYHWQVYNSGVVKYGFFEVTETLDVAMIVILLSAYLGQDVWTVTVYITKNIQIDLRVIGIALICLGGILKIIEIIFSNFQYSFDQTVKGPHKGFQAIFPGIPITWDAVFIYLACIANPALYSGYPMLFSTAMTMITMKPISEVMVAHFTQSTMALITINVIFVALFALNAYMSLVGTKVSLILLLVLGSLDFLFYYYRMVSDMNDCLGFQWFSLHKKKKTE